MKGPDTAFSLFTHSGQHGTADKRLAGISYQD